MSAKTDEQVRKGLILLRDGLLPFVENEMERQHGSNWYEIPEVVKTIQNQRRPRQQGVKPNLDSQALLNIICNCWKDVFALTLNQEARTLVNELRSIRN